jgi:cyclic pyranopterin phosphate synthase
MEALNAASTYLLTVWDMVKPYEKDMHGQYPDTRILDLRVVTKSKG